MLDRRTFLKTGAAAGAAVSFNLMAGLDPASAHRIRPTPPQNLADPAIQPKFVEVVPNALDPSFLFHPHGNRYTIAMKEGRTRTGLVNADGRRVRTTIYGYAQDGGPTWPGMTIVANKDQPIRVKWENHLPTGHHRLPLDENLHWAYSLEGYEHVDIDHVGPPVVTHLHGGHTQAEFDGNPEQFFSPWYRIKGPRFPGKWYRYDNDQPASTLWYHDHALGLTRLNVYAGLAGFYILRDEHDTGEPDNPLRLPAFPYEMALAIQDRMFTKGGALFYPAFPGEPFYDDFITGEGAVLPPDLFPRGGPTALAEFFGDHMLVNGKIWPRAQVEPRNYRLRLLNGCDSRFLFVEFWEVPPGATDFASAIQKLDFRVIGSDQGLSSRPRRVDGLLIETGARYDVIFDFKKVTPGNRVIMRNIGGDEPFGGDIPGPQVFGETDRIMAFDVDLPRDTSVPDRRPTGISFGPVVPSANRRRKVALFEGKDEFGRLQPLLGTAEPATDFAGNPINWPATAPYADNGLVGQMEGSIAWHSPTTENPALGSTETWDVWNVTGDAHPVHLHLVNFKIIRRRAIIWDSATNEEDRVLDPAGVTAPPPNGDGTYLVTQPVVQHNGAVGTGFRIMSHTVAGGNLPRPAGYVENAPKDLVTALPGQVTRIRATFDRPGRYVWHCHILSHEDHEMMRVLHVGSGA